MCSDFAFNGKIMGVKNDYTHFARETAPSKIIGKPLGKEFEGNRKEGPQPQQANDISDSEPMSTPTVHCEPNLLGSSASYTVLTRAAHLESNVDHWLQNDTDTEDEGRQRRQRPGFEQSSMPSYRSSFAMFWYLMAMLPMFSAPRRGWCSPARTTIMSVLNTVDVFATYIKEMTARARTQVSRLAMEQVLSECFAVGMEIVLTLHAFVFLVLSLYQAIITV